MQRSSGPVVREASARADPRRIWFAAARPRTLAAGVVPVAVGTALASAVAPIRWEVAGATLVGALLIQIGCNFANDAYDALRGADTPDRLGPTRAVAAGLVAPRTMLRATAYVLLLALAVGLWLAFVAGGGWGILALGLASLACAVAYTGGPAPLAYHGLGDLFVLLFFGFAAVLGAAWMQVAVTAPDLPGAWWLVAAAVGLQATAIIAVNNLRDIPTDARVGKRTLAVRLGDRASRWYYLGVHVGAVACLAAVAVQDGGWWWLPVAVAAVGGGVAAAGVARAMGSALNPWLGRTAVVECATGVAVIAAVVVQG
jgi:1,4-dihydroxy-2-naphthoate polyprenyltransferase